VRIEEAVRRGDACAASSWAHGPSKLEAAGEDALTVFTAGAAMYFTANAANVTQLKSMKARSHDSVALRFAVRCGLSTTNSRGVLRSGSTAGMGIRSRLLMELMTASPLASFRPLPRTRKYAMGDERLS
jgi:hypothetical protein